MTTIDLNRCITEHTVSNLQPPKRSLLNPSFFTPHLPSSFSLPMPSRNASGASVDGEPPSKRSSTEHSSSCSTAAGDLKKVGLWPSNRWAYFALSACFLLMFNCWGMINVRHTLSTASSPISYTTDTGSQAYGTFASYYDQQLMPKTSKLLLNLIGSTQSALVLSLSLPIGRLLDAGKSSYIIALGTVLQAIGLFGLSAVNGDGNMGQSNYALIWFTQGLIQGLGMSCFFVTSSWGKQTSLLPSYPVRLLT